MKKFLLSLVLLAALSGCSKDENITPDSTTNVIPAYPILPPLPAYEPESPDPREPLAELENGMKLVWHDEFNDPKGVKPDDTKWTYEQGMVRNNELQSYTDNNAFCDGNGNMVIEGRIERVKNPLYKSDGKNWNQKIEYADYSSASITTQEKYAFTYGQVIIRAKLPTAKGAWPAMWTLGTKWDWPSNGELDIMEYYLQGGTTPAIWANACWASDTPWVGTWDSVATPFSKFFGKDSRWNEKYHIWREEWDENTIRIYLDDELLNEIDLRNIRNGKNVGTGGEGENPFRHEHYLLLNLALGAQGGEPYKPQFPLKYYIDYVRVYQAQ